MGNSNENVSLYAFPSDRNEALAILYLQNQDLSGKTPEELANMYADARNRIYAEFKAIRERERQKQNKPSLSFVTYD